MRPWDIIVQNSTIAENDVRIGKKSAGIYKTARLAKLAEVESQCCRPDRVKSSVFDGIIKNNNNKLIVETDNSVAVSSNSSLLGIVVHNLIDNANKHTIKGRIKK